MCPPHFRYRKSFIKPPAGEKIFFFQVHFLRGEGGLFYLVKCINGSKVSRGRTCATWFGRYTAFSNNKKMATILHRELERKAEKVQHMKLELMRSKTKNNMNFHPE